MPKPKTQSAADAVKELLQGTKKAETAPKPLAANSAKTQPNGKKPRGPGKPFKPGQSGNPAGPKPGYHHGKTYLLKVIKERAKTADGKSMEVGEALARAAVQAGLRGDIRAFNAVFDRIDGKAPQPHVGDDGEDPIRIDLGIDKILEKGYGE